MFISSLSFIFTFPASQLLQYCCVFYTVLSGSTITPLNHFSHYCWKSVQWYSFIGDGNGFLIHEHQPLSVIYLPHIIFHQSPRLPTYKTTILHTVSATPKPHWNLKPCSMQKNYSVSKNGPLKLMKTFSIASDITHLIFSTSFYLDKLNPVTASNLDPTTLNSLISTTTEILLTACFLSIPQRVTCRPN